MSEHFSKTMGGIFQKPGWTPNPGWDFPKAWLEFSTNLGGVICLPPPRLAATHPVFFRSLNNSPKMVMPDTNEIYMDNNYKLHYPDGRERAILLLKGSCKKMVFFSVVTIFVSIESKNI